MPTSPSIPPSLQSLLEEKKLTPVSNLQALSGGDMAAVYRLETRQGTVVVKHDAATRLQGEADGLQALKAAQTPLVIPDVLGQAGEWLVMEALNPSGRSDGAALGEGLRALHAHHGEQHGWHQDNACGHTPQPNAPLADGRDFQRKRRLLPLSAACHERGLLDQPLRRRIEAIAEALETWLPDTAPRLVHGDLWSGNVLYTPSGPALIDPAVYYHLPEVDLAMLTLFGAPGEAFFEAYWNGHAPADWPRREALFQLYPLLNHLLLFGGAYRRGVERCVAKLSG
ncbi:fructosamine kinase family protein [Vreelandella massiliensis]|uniref:fructosamine kinase family protein n=1 Tax=Vreelandella massiliensis TaxID=1816686 RepID=UPI00096A6396|nr:fructosamine kinase family protein [Halomonas massiliensis]